MKNIIQETVIASIYMFGTVMGLAMLVIALYAVCGK